MSTPFTGLRVVDLGQIYNAPYATLLLAYHGADVIKVEPLGGENLRGRGHAAGAGAPFAMLNSNKRSVTLNLKSPEGTDILRQLTATADVLVENYRPGVMDKLGLPASELMAANPRLIYASGSGYGTTGRYRDYPAMDLTIQAMAGIMAVTGFPENPPVKAGPAFGDFLGGIHLYGGIVTALYERERTGRGQRVEVAMLDAVYPSMMSSLGLYFGRATGDPAPTRTGNRHSGLAEAPYNVYAALDGHVAIICVTETHWTRLTELMDRSDLRDDPDYATRSLRVARLDEVDDAVNAWMGQYHRETALNLLRSAGVPCAPVREISEVVHDPHLHERGMLQDIDHPLLGPLVVPHSPILFDGERTPVHPSPQLGQHNAEVYGDLLGLDAQELRRLSEEGVI